MPILETRLISGKGVLKLDKTTDGFKKAKVITVRAEVVRFPFNEYANFAYNPSRGRFATLNFVRDDCVIKSTAMEFEQQMWDFYPEPSAQTMYAVQCAYKGILDTFVNLGTALGLPPISYEDNIKDWQHIKLWFDTIKVVCYADTAIRLVASSNPYDLCPDQDKDGDDPPPPPPPRPSVDLGQPLGNGENPPVSPAYDNDTDGGDTVPYAGDSDTPPPPPPSGQRLNVVVLWFFNDDLGNGRTTNAFVWGDVTGVRSVGDGGVGHLQLLCYGYAPSTSSPVLSAPEWVDIVEPGGLPQRYGNVNQPSIVSSTPV